MRHSRNVYLVEVVSFGQLDCLDLYIRVAVIESLERGIKRVPFGCLTRVIKKL
jgi:hypothetical protein